MATKMLLTSVTCMSALLAPLVVPIPAAAGVTCFGQEPTILGDEDAETIRGTSGDDVIMSFEGNDRIFARGGDDAICAGSGNDRVRGGRGGDAIAGQRGSDVPFESNRRPDVKGGLLGNRGGDMIFGGHGIDRLQGGRGDDALRGGQGPDNGVGVAGISSGGTDGVREGGKKTTGGQYHASWAGILRGGGGSDRLAGGQDDDWLDSRDGIEFNDELDGGTGANDTCQSDPDDERRC